MLTATRQQTWVEKFALIETTDQFNPKVKYGVAEIFPDAIVTTGSKEWSYAEGYENAQSCVRTGGAWPWGNTALFCGVPVGEWVSATGGPVPEDWKESDERAEKHGQDGVDGPSRSSVVIPGALNRRAQSIGEFDAPS